MMSRPMALVFLLMILIITSQFEWKQQLVSEIDSSSSITPKQQKISKREETVKEKIIFSQEKVIRRLNELVQTLQEHLVQCRCGNKTVDESFSSPTSNVIELARKPVLDD